MKRKLKYIFFFTIVLLSFNVKAQPPDSLFSAANVLYEQESYNEAAILYHEVVSQGYESAALFYNLGNTYYKLDEIPRAILFYERALRLDPGNEDISYNIKMANMLIVDRIETIPEFFLKGWWNDFLNIFDLSTWTILSLIFYFSLFIFASFYLLSRKIIIKKLSFFIGLFIIFAAILSFTAGFQKKNKLENENFAIVFEQTITVKSSPNIKSVDLFVIHEGLKVEVLTTIGDWCKVKIASGSVGWIPKESLESI